MPPHGLIDETNSREKASRNAVRVLFYSAGANGLVIKAQIKPWQVHAGFIKPSKPSSNELFQFFTDDRQCVDRPLRAECGSCQPPQQFCVSAAFFSLADGCCYLSYPNPFEEPSIRTKNSYRGSRFAFLNPCATEICCYGCRPNALALQRHDASKTCSRSSPYLLLRAWYGITKAGITFAAH